MNKQYVKEQIAIAIRELKEEYDGIIGNIYQCPDCGGLALRNAEHICLGAAKVESQSAAPAVKSRKLVDYVIAALPTEPPADPLAVFERDSPYLPSGIEQRVIDMGYEGRTESTGPALADLRYANRIKAMAVTVKESGSRRGKHFPRLTTSFAYWRPA